LEIMGREGINQLPVVDGGRLYGLVSREQIIALLTARMELSKRPGRTERERPTQIERNKQGRIIDRAA
jgi:CBS domain-containing protein